MSSVLSFLSICSLSLLCATGCRYNVSTTEKENYRITDTAIIQTQLTRAINMLPQYPDSAIAILNQILVLSREVHFTGGIILSQMIMGNAYFYKGLYDSALQYYEQGQKQALSLRRPGHDLGSYNNIAATYNNIAATNIQLNNFNEGLRILLKVADIHERKKQYNVLPGIYNNIGVVLMNMNDNNRALYYFQKGDKLAVKTAAPAIRLIPLYINECRALLNMGNVESSKEKCQQALDLLKKHPDPMYKIQADYLLGMLYEKEGQQAKAAEIYCSILNRKEELFNDKLLAAARLGGIYRHRNNYPEAERYYMQALALAEKLNSPLNQSAAFYDLSQLYKKKGDYIKAMEYIERYMILRDSVQSLEKMKETAQMEIRYRTAEKDKVIAENQLMITNQQAGLFRKNMLLGTISAGTLIIIGGFFFFYRNRQRAELQQQQLALLHAATDGEEKERSRIARELHDGIGGQLSLLKMHLGIMENRLPEVRALDVYLEASNMLDNTVNDIRKTAHNLMPELLLKHGLSEATRIFCEQVQDNEGLTINYQHYGFIDGPDKRFELSVYRIVQELVHNVIKHAQASFALVQLSQHNDILDVTIEDNGRGMQESAGATDGMGLESIRQRVRELQGKINISSSAGSGTTVYIEFNLKLLKSLKK